MTDSTVGVEFINDVMQPVIDAARDAALQAVPLVIEKTYVDKANQKA